MKNKYLIKVTPYEKMDSDVTPVAIEIYKNEETTPCFKDQDFDEESKPDTYFPNMAWQSSELTAENIVGILTLFGFDTPSVID